MPLKVLRGWPDHTHRAILCPFPADGPMGNESSPAVLKQHATLPALDVQLVNQRPGIESWFEARWREVPPPFYASVDLRNAGFKLAPIDTNLFPAGFNNLKPAFRPICTEAIQREVAKICSTAKRVLIVPENHTRNLYYFESLATLVDILAAGGLTVRIGSLLGDLTEPHKVELPSGRTILLEPLVRTDNRIQVRDFEPCFVLLNNDLSSGRPPILEGLDQPVVPPPALGWTNRRKSNHFAHYRRVAEEFSETVGIDPWLIDPIFRNCGHIDFLKHAGQDCLAAYVDEVLAAVAKKYREYGIDQEPFVVIKSDSGTYGMAIMTVRSAAEVRDLNRKQRTRMAHAQEGLAVTQLLVQEGVYTLETVGEPPASAEPVIYMIGPTVVGGFFRIHGERGPTENLNAPGIRFG